MLPPEVRTRALPSWRRTLSGACSAVEKEFDDAAENDGKRQRRGRSGRPRHQRREDIEQEHVGENLSRQLGVQLAALDRGADVLHELEAQRLLVARGLDGGDA